MVIVNYILTALFALESLAKSIGNYFKIHFSNIFYSAYGFILQPNSYLRDNYNKLDFLIVCLSIIDIPLSGKRFTYNFNITIICRP